VITSPVDYELGALAAPHRFVDLQRLPERRPWGELILAHRGKQRDQCCR